VTDWIHVDNERPNRREPIVYARKRPDGTWSVGIAYWTVSEKWAPAMNSEQAPEGFTHWKPLGEVPR
jgi:hypothetical protein